MVSKILGGAVALCLIATPMLSCKEGEKPKQDQTNQGKALNQEKLNTTKQGEQSEGSNTAGDPTTSQGASNQSTTDRQTDSSLIAFKAATSTNKVGFIDLKLEITPSQILGKVIINRADGQMSPTEPCDSGKEIAVFTEADAKNMTIEDDTGKPGEPFSYRVCTFSKDQLLLQSIESSNVIAKRSPSHLIFVTSRLYRADMGGVAGADKICNNHAKLIGNLDGNFKAILSAVNMVPEKDDTSLVHARDRILIEAPILNTAGKLVAPDAKMFWSEFHKNPILYDELGAEQPDNVWTGTAVDGSLLIDGKIPGGFFQSPKDISYNCWAWTKASIADNDPVAQRSGRNLKISAQLGRSDAVDRKWVTSLETFDLEEGEPIVAALCSDMHRIYCISQFDH